MASFQYQWDKLESLDSDVVWDCEKVISIYFSFSLWSSSILDGHFFLSQVRWPFWLLNRLPLYRTQSPTLDSTFYDTIFSRWKVGPPFQKQKMMFIRTNPTITGITYIMSLQLVQLYHLFYKKKIGELDFVGLLDLRHDSRLK